MKKIDKYRTLLQKKKKKKNPETMAKALRRELFPRVVNIPGINLQLDRIPIPFSNKITAERIEPVPYSLSDSGFLFFLPKIFLSDLDM